MPSACENFICYTIAPASFDSREGNCRNPGLGGMMWIFKPDSCNFGLFNVVAFSPKYFPALLHVTKRFPVEAAQGLSQKSGSLQCTYVSLCSPFARVGS